MIDELEALKKHNEQLVSFIEWLATQYSFALSLALDNPDEPFIALRLARMRDEWAKAEIPWQPLSE